MNSGYSTAENHDPTLDVKDDKPQSCCGPTGDAAVYRPSISFDLPNGNHFEAKLLRKLESRTELKQLEQLLRTLVPLAFLSADADEES